MQQALAQVLLPALEAGLEHSMTLAQQHCDIGERTREEQLAQHGPALLQQCHFTAFAAVARPRGQLEAPATVPAASTALRQRAMKMQRLAPSLLVEVALPRRARLLLRLIVSWLQRLQRGSNEDIALRRPMQLLLEAHRHWQLHRWRCSRTIARRCPPLLRLQTLLLRCRLAPSLSRRPRASAASSQATRSPRQQQQPSRSMLPPKSPCNLKLLRWQMLMLRPRAADLGQHWQALRMALWRQAVPLMTMHCQ